MLWADAGGGASGAGAWTQGECGNAAPLDAEGGAVEPCAEASSDAAAAGTQGTLWGTGAVRRKSTCVARRARAARLPDGHGDDATSVAEIRLEQQETTWAAARVLRNWIERHGVPLALYVDRKNVYVSSGSEQEQMSGKPALTQFGRMCQKLGIRNHRRWFAAGQRASGAGARNAPGPSGEG